MIVELEESKVHLEDGGRGHEPGNKVVSTTRKARNPFPASLQSSPAGSDSKESACMQEA